MEQDNVKTSNDIMSDMTRQCKSTQAEKMAQINSNIAEINQSNDEIDGLNANKAKLVE